MVVEVVVAGSRPMTTSGTRAEVVVVDVVVAGSRLQQQLVAEDRPPREGVVVVVEGVVAGARQQQPVADRPHRPPRTRRRISLASSRL